MTAQKATATNPQRDSVAETEEIAGQQLSKADRVLRLLEERKSDVVKGISKYEHALQTATRAYRSKASEDWVVAALLHDVMGGLCPQNHAVAAAELMAPYVSREIYHALRMHDRLQDDNWTGRTHSSDDHINSPMAIKLVDEWDLPSFDPDYESLPLEFFRPMVERIIR